MGTGSHGESYVSSRLGLGVPGSGGLGNWLLLDSHRGTGGHRGPGKGHGPSSSASIRAQLSLPAAAPLLDITCFEHSPRPLVFSPAQSQFQFTVALSTHLAGIPGLLPQAGLSGPRRSLVTRWGTKSLFAKHSVSGAHFPLALP